MAENASVTLRYSRVRGRELDKRNSAICVPDDDLLYAADGRQFRVLEWTTTVRREEVIAIPRLRIEMLDSEKQ